jgi:hypothetical protein
MQCLETSTFTTAYADMNHMGHDTGAYDVHAWHCSLSGLVSLK